MNPIVLKFADGTTFFVGLALVLAAEVLAIRLRNRTTRPILTILVIVGVILVVISATPLPIWAYVGWAIPAVAGLVLLNRGASSQRARLVVCAVLLAATAGLCVAEIPHRRLPQLTTLDGRTVYVLGDSISAGTRTGERCWPTVLADMTNLRVVNLAQAGAKVEDAIVQARGIAEPGSLVIVEIGGNDLLGGTDAAVFHSKLATLVSSLRADRHQVLIVELPLPPFRNAFGRAQRRVVAQYGTAMLPKRCFTGVLTAKGGTRDGLHLSQAGHEAMAAIMAEVIVQE
jgi:acyl-CoA thioesterase I